MSPPSPQAPFSTSSAVSFLQIMLYLLLSCLFPGGILNLSYESGTAPGAGIQQAAASALKVRFLLRPSDTPPRSDILDAGPSSAPETVNSKLTLSQSRCALGFPSGGQQRYPCCPAESLGIVFSALSFSCLQLLGPVEAAACVCSGVSLPLPHLQGPPGTRQVIQPRATAFCPHGEA